MEDMSGSFFLGRTYDDFLFRPQRGRVGSRRAVRLTGAFTPGIALELPVVSANMDSVTESRMARAMALEGGLGVVHRAMSIEAQGREVERVKRSHGWVVEEPIAIPRGATLREARELARRHGVTGILVEESRGSGRLAGLLSQRDLPWGAARDQEPVERFMTPFDRLVTAAPGTTLEEAERLLYEHRVEKLPLVDEARVIRGLITKSDISLARERPDSTKDGKGRLRVAAAIGARGDFLERAEALRAAGADALVVDIAHGHSDVMERAVKSLRQRFPDLELVCGNVGTAEGARFLVELGASAVKVGIGPGRGCRTRLETAAGVPQLQAVHEVWQAVGNSVPIIADGGVRFDKDIFLALCCGASSVMLGSLLSGTDESPGSVILDPATGEKRKIYRGMTSPQAVFQALYDDAGSEEAEAALETPSEGQEVQVAYQGALRDLIQRIRGHLQSAVSYGGEASLHAVRAKVLAEPEGFLIPLSAASRRESFER